MKITKIILPVLVVLFSACGNSSSDSGYTDHTSVSETEAASTQPSRKLPFAVTAAELCSDFNGDVASAVQKYQGRLIELSGTVQMLQKLNEGDCDYITLECEGNPSDSVNMIIKCCLTNLSGLKDSATIGYPVTFQAYFRELDQNIIILEEAVPQQ